MRKKVSNKENRNNMRRYGDQVIIKEEQIMFVSVKEIIREEDVEEEEDEHIQQKFKETACLVEKDARVSMNKIQMTVSAMK